MQRYDRRNYHQLTKTTIDGAPQALPRVTTYGSRAATDNGLLPTLALRNDLYEPDDYKLVIHDCHRETIFPRYHQARSKWAAAGWNQGHYGYCWAYGLTAATMDCIEAEGHPPVRLAPFSLGWMVKWKNTGYYCDSAIIGARQRGIASADSVPEYNLEPRSFKQGWETDALKYRPLEWWDTKNDTPDSMTSQCLTILATGRPCYVNWYWWGHAAELVAMDWDESLAYPVTLIVRNSHAETDLIELTGHRGIPDEAYGIRTVSLPF